MHWCCILACDLSIEMDDWLKIVYACFLGCWAFVGLIYLDGLLGICLGLLKIFNIVNEFYGDNYCSGEKKIGELETKT